MFMYEYVMILQSVFAEPELQGAALIWWSRRQRIMRCASGSKHDIQHTIEQINNKTFEEQMAKPLC
jgi:signal recognition particle GTPase